jgi:hypothetical protein
MFAFFDCLPQDNMLWPGAKLKEGTAIINYFDHSIIISEKRVKHNDKYIMVK